MNKLRQCHARVPGDDILDGMIKEVGPYAFSVYVVLCLHQDWETHRTYPSKERMRELTGFDIRTIDRAIAKLIEKEYITDIELRKSRDKNGKEVGHEHYFYTLRIVSPTPDVPLTKEK